jgi:hypothetical protein
MTMVTLVDLSASPGPRSSKAITPWQSHPLLAAGQITTPENGDIAEMTILVRLPSLIAGSLIPIASPGPSAAAARNWPCQGHRGRTSPWLITISTRARGCASLLLAILATNFRQPETPSLVLLLAAAAPYPASRHPPRRRPGLTTLLIRREIFLTWFRSALLTGLLTFLLYLPFLHGAHHYWSKPEQPSGPYPQFILSSLRYSFWGGDVGGTLPIIVSLLIFIAGSWAARGNPQRR